MSKSWIGGLLSLFCLGLTTTAYANYTTKYEVTITNITKGQTFTPQLVATHNGRISLFELGQPASKALEILAEAGDTMPLTEGLLAQSHNIGEVQTVPGLLMPGTSVTVIVEASYHHRFISVAAMLIPTNDTFVALNKVRLPLRGTKRTRLKAYDAGTEANDQNCQNIPGPICGGEGHSPGPNEGDEGYVYIGNGFHTLPESDSDRILGPLQYDWRNPVAEVIVKRLR